MLDKVKEEGKELERKFEKILMDQGVRDCLRHEDSSLFIEFPVPATSAITIYFTITCIYLLHS